MANCWVQIETRHYQFWIQSRMSIREIWFIHELRSFWSIKQLSRRWVLLSRSTVRYFWIYEIFYLLGWTKIGNIEISSRFDTLFGQFGDSKFVRNSARNFKASRLVQWAEKSWGQKRSCCGNQKSFWLKSSAGKTLKKS